MPGYDPQRHRDEFVIMPNHIHGIIWIVETPEYPDDTVGARRRAPTVRRRAPKVEQFGKPVPGSIPTIVHAFKSAVTRRINALRGTPGARVWQRNYYEHIIRNDRALNAIRRYIAENTGAGTWTDTTPTRLTLTPGSVICGAGCKTTPGPIPCTLGLPQLEGEPALNYRTPRENRKENEGSLLGGGRKKGRV